MPLESPGSEPVGPPELLADVLIKRAEEWAEEHEYDLRELVIIPVLEAPEESHVWTGTAYHGDYGDEDPGNAILSCLVMQAQRTAKSMGKNLRDLDWDAIG